MAVVKANYVKRGRGEKGRAKATIRYITHRRDRDGKKQPGHSSALMGRSPRNKSTG